MLTAGYGKNYCTIPLEAGTTNTALSSRRVLQAGQTLELQSLPAKP